MLMAKSCSGFYIYIYIHVLVLSQSIPCPPPRFTPQQQQLRCNLPGECGHSNYAHATCEWFCFCFPLPYSFSASAISGTFDVVAWRHLSELPVSVGCTTCGKTGGNRNEWVMAGSALKLRLRAKACCRRVLPKEPNCAYTLRMRHMWLSWPDFPLLTEYIAANCLDLLVAHQYQHAQISRAAGCLLR